jgi:Flp pilus assembly protein TadD
MKSPRLQSVTAFLTRLAFCFLAVAGTLYIAPHLGNQLFGREQSPSSSATQSKSRKLANPLNDLLDEAQRDIDKNEFETAISPLRKVLAEEPEFAYAHFQLAYVYTALKRMDDARGEYERAISLDPKMAEAYLNLGILLLYKPDFPAAVATLRKAVEFMPGKPEVLYDLAVAQNRSGDDEGAEESFEALLRLDPDHYAANVSVGDYLMSKNKLQEAEARFRHALEIDPNGSALNELAVCLEAQKKKAEAVDAYRQYVTRFADVDARIRLIHLLMEQEQYDAALAEIDRVPPVTRVPQGLIPPLESLKLRADIQIAQNHLDDAVATLRKSIALAPNDAQLHGGLGRLFLQERDFPAAEKELNVAIQLDQNNLAYWKDLSSTFYLAGKYQGALAALDVIAKSESPGAGAWFIRALCYDKLNQAQPALDAYQKFLELAVDKKSDQVWQAEQRSKVLRRILDQKR